MGVLGNILDRLSPAIRRVLPIDVILHEGFNELIMQNVRTYRRLSISDTRNKLGFAIYVPGNPYIPHWKIHLNRPPEKADLGAFAYRSKKLHYQDLERDVIKLLRSCGFAWLGDGLSYGPMCHQCPYQLHCMALEDEVRIKEKRTLGT